MVKACLFSILGILLSVRILAQEVSQIDRGQKDQERRSLTRLQDFIVIRGNQLQQTLHTRIDQLSVFASIDGHVQAVPFQVDEINEEGEWVLPHGPPQVEKGSRHLEKDGDNGVLDENDELVFMIRDSGDRVPETHYPEGAQIVEEIMLRDPIDNGRSWVYLCTFPCNPPLSPNEYVSYNYPENMVLSRNYKLRFSFKVPISWEHLSFQGFPNMIDRLKIRMTMSIFGLPYYRDETHFRSELSSYKDGPVRVIRRVRSSIKLNPILKTPSVASESIYYENAIVIPFRIKIPVRLKSLIGIVKDIRVRGGADMQNVHGWTLRTDVEDRWLNIDGKMDDLEKNLRGEGASWFILSGPPGAFLCRIILNKKPDGSLQSLPIKSTFFYMDDDSSLDPPEFVPGQSPNIGFWMTGFEELPRGDFYFYMIGYMLPDYKKGMETDCLNIMDQPIQVIVGEQRRTSAPSNQMVQSP